MNTSWVLAELREFLDLTVVSFDGFTHVNAGDRGDIVAKAQVVEKVFDRVLPTWRVDFQSDGYDLWDAHREVAQRVVVELQRREEIAENLGETAPELSAAVMHPWIWDAARSLWTSGHFREAVSAAAVKVNAETQNKLGRRDISETELFRQALSAGDPGKHVPRLRLRGDDGGKTALSKRRGVMAFAEGCYAAIRNPASHDTLDEISDAEALEQLAAFSLLARWVDTATVDRG